MEKVSTMMILIPQFNIISIKTLMKVFGMVGT